MNKKGFTLVEIIASISLISVVVIFLFQIIITIKNLNDSEVSKTNNQMAVAIITREVEKDLNSFGLEQEPTTTCDTTQKNIIPATAENIKCIKLIYRSINVKNNEGYIIYYTNKKKSFLAYKRGKNNTIETQTVREISIEPNNELDIEIIPVSSEDNGLSSLKMIVPIRKDTQKYDLVINYVDSKPITEGDSTFATMLSKLDKSSNGLEVDDTDDQNLRYVGSNPKNYILFNDETWRIIGIFNVYNTETSSNEELVKIIRNESLGEYVWDTSASNDNSGWGKSDWTQADLKNELNTDYLDTSKTSGTTTWYNGYSNLKTANYNYSNNIKSNYIDKIATIRWNLGTINYGIGALSSYNLERSGSLTWNGKIALMYPSDYSYATVSKNISCREDMFNKSEGNETGVCASQNWLHNSQATQLTLATGANDNCTIYMIGNGGVDQMLPGYNIDIIVRPVLYLKSSVKITGGTGAATNPYTIN